MSSFDHFVDPQHPAVDPQHPAHAYIDDAEQLLSLLRTNYEGIGSKVYDLNNVSANKPKNDEHLHKHIPEHIHEHLVRRIRDLSLGFKSFLETVVDGEELLDYHPPQPPPDSTSDSTSCPGQPETSAHRAQDIEIDDAPPQSSDDESSSSSFSTSSSTLYPRILIIGASASGLGLASCLLASGLPPSSLLIVERSTAIASSFVSWPPFTRFISPSFNGQGWGAEDLNVIAPQTEATGGIGLQIVQASMNAAKSDDQPDDQPDCNPVVNSQHPTGLAYKNYLESVVDNNPGLRDSILLGHEVVTVAPLESKGFHVTTKSAATSGETELYAGFVIYCGGEFNWPRTFVDPNPTPSSYHYATLEREYPGGWEGYARDVNNKRKSVPSEVHNQIIVIGTGESGIDAALYLLSNTEGVEIVLSSRSEFEPSFFSPTTDPSRGLSPVTSYRLKVALADPKMKSRLKFEFGLSLVKFKQTDGEFSAALFKPTDRKNTFFDLASGTAFHELFSQYPIINCTGFTPFSPENPLLKSLFKIDSRNNYPVLDVACDESTLVSGVFLCGPLVRHYVKKKTTGEGIDDRNRCGVRDFEIESGGLEEEGEEEEIIMCYIYKFRTRFALVAGEIMSRIIVEDHIIEEQRHEGHFGCNSSHSASRDVKKSVQIDDDGHLKLLKVEKMLEEYKGAGMLVADLSCVSCGSGGAAC